MFNGQKVAFCLVSFIVLTGGLIGGWQGSGSYFHGKWVEASEHLSPEETFAEHVAQVQQLIQEGQYPEAKQRMNEIDHLFTQLSFENKTSVEGIESLSYTIMELKYALMNVSPNSEELEQTSLQLYLATDALFHKEQPLWKNTYNQFQTTIQSLENSENLQQRMVQWKRLNQLYQNIRPALLVDISSIQINQLDSLMKQLQQLSVEEEQDDDQWQNSTKQLKQLMDEIFWGEDETTLGTMMKAPFTQLILMFAVILFLSLGYFSYRYVPR